MNLIAKEYIASRQDRTGVLILSEMAGAAKELTEAIIINPNNIEEISDALKEALEMPVEEQIHRNAAMQRRLSRYDLNRWAGDFLQMLVKSRERQEGIETRYVIARLDEFVQEFWHRGSRVLFLDYDGTLVPLMTDPTMACPNQQLLTILRALCAIHSTSVVIVSGRDRKTLDEWFGHLPIGIIGEHGVWIKQKAEGWRLSKPLENSWKSKITPLLESFADRLPGAFVEEKEYSLVLHYRRSDPDLASIRTGELTDRLAPLIVSLNLEILRGSKVLEIRNERVNKGFAATQFLGDDPDAFVVGIGDDLTDEDLFQALPRGSITIHVGVTPSMAGYSLKDPAEVLQFLTALTGQDAGSGNHPRPRSNPNFFIKMVQ
jgi:trehalose 6-phosphate synthase/phosphatase